MIEEHRPQIGHPYATSQSRDLGREERRSTVRPIALAAGLSALLVLAPQASAIQSINESGDASISASEAFTILDSVLTGARAGRIETQAGDYAMAADCKLYLRHGGAIRPIADLSPYVGEAIQLQLRNDRAVWIVIESKEILR